LAPYDEGGLAVSAFCFSATGATFPTQSPSQSEQPEPAGQKP
jgi:hypothetical protein